MMLDGLIPAHRWPLRVGLRLAGLGGIVYGIVVISPGVGGAGRPLAALVCTVLAAAGWLGWLVATTVVDRPAVLVGSIVLLTVAGSLLAGIDPASPALALCGVGVFTAAFTLPSVGAVGLVVAGIAALAVGTFAVGNSLSPFAGYGGALAGITLAGFNRRQYRARFEQAELLLVQTRRAQQEQARAATLGERARIAREIHDVLAHSLGALAVQLDAADALLTDDRDPARAHRHVRRARRLAVDGLGETRRAIAALRGETAPLPDLLTGLAGDYQADIRAPAQVTVRGVPRELAPDMALTAYRTAQEALTNARKHAPGAPMTIELDYRPDDLVLTITDHPATAVPPAVTSLADTGGGYGLAGLRERAELIGGTLTCGPTPTGWAVRLRLPA